MQIGDWSGEMEKAKAGGERQDQQECAIAIDGAPARCGRMDGLTKNDILDSGPSITRLFGFPYSPPTGGIGTPKGTEGEICSMRLLSTLTPKCIRRKTVGSVGV
jgi:hypothetical protein